MFNKRLKRINQKMAEILFENIKYTVELSMDNQKLNAFAKNKINEVNALKKEIAELKSTIAQDHTYKVAFEGHIFNVTSYEYVKSAGAVSTLVVTAREVVNTSKPKEDDVEVLD